jgi:hypothetical protein
MHRLSPSTNTGRTKQRFPIHDKTALGIRIRARIGRIAKGPAMAGPFIFKTRSDFRQGLNATGGLGKASHFAGSFAGSGGEKLIDVLEFEPGKFGKNAYHGSNTVLLVVILKDIDHTPMFIGEGFNAFFLHAVLNPFFGIGVEVFQKSVFVDYKLFAFEFNFSHFSKTSCNRIDIILWGVPVISLTFS